MKFAQQINKNEVDNEIIISLTFSTSGHKGSIADEYHTSTGNKFIMSDICNNDIPVSTNPLDKMFKTIIIKKVGKGL